MKQYPELEKYLAKVKDGKPLFSSPVDIIHMMGNSRRSERVINHLENLLDQLNLEMEPDFANTHCYANVIIRTKKKKEESEEQTNNDSVEEIIVTNPENDPIPRVSRITSANLINKETKESKLVYVSKDDDIQKVSTLMIKHEYSQLPVLSNKNHKVEGLVSWSSIGEAIALGEKPLKASDCMRNVELVSLKTSLLQVVEKIVKHDVVLVHNSEQEICGIITASDITEQFLEQAESFFLVEQIEKQVRFLLDKLDFVNDILPYLERPKIEIEKKERELTDIYDCNFGDYVYALQNDECFNKLNLTVDKKIFTGDLEKIRLIRNNVMHFNPDGLSDDEVIQLRAVAKLLSKINK